MGGTQGEGGFGLMVEDARKPSRGCPKTSGGVCSKSNTVALGNLTSIWEWPKSRGRTTKVKISQNLCVRFTPEQFSSLLEVKSDPAVASFGRFYSLSKFP